MTKLIIVRGASNSGKTTSIRLLAERYGIFLPKERKDFVVVITITKNGVTLRIAIVTGGDIERMINDGQKFAREHNCDIIVCATKSSGVTIRCMDSWIAQSESHVFVDTRRVNGADAIAMEVSRVIAEIDANIP